MVNDVTFLELSSTVMCQINWRKGYLTVVLSVGLAQWGCAFKVITIQVAYNVYKGFLLLNLPVRLCDKMNNCTDHSV